MKLHIRMRTTEAAPENAEGSQFSFPQLTPYQKRIHAAQSSLLKFISDLQQAEDVRDPEFTCYNDQIRFRFLPPSPSRAPADSDQNSASDQRGCR